MTVAELKSIRKTKKNLFNTYAKRRNGVRDIVSNIDNKLDDEVRSVNDRIGKCITELQQGLKGSTKVSALCTDMAATKESYPGSDSKLSSCKSNVKSEQSRCQGCINTLDSEICSIENQIREQGGTIYWWE